MPNCTIILHRHSGLERIGARPTTFVADRLGPMLEGRMTNGNALHVIHDRIPSHPLDKNTMENFEAASRSRKARRIWGEYDKKWREGAKKALSRADDGEDCEMLTRAFCPDAALILDRNRERPGTIINHLGFYPIEAAIEYTLYRIELTRSNQCAGRQELRASVEHRMLAHEALASSNLLRDMELMRQVRHLDLDVVVLRSMNHVYLGDLEAHSIPIAPDRFIVMEFHEFVAQQGVHITAVAEELPLTYGEQAVNILCSGGIDKVQHRELALKELMLTAFLVKRDGWGDPEMWEAGYLATERDYEDLRSRVYGKGR